jgi:hypothetical protein
MNKEGKNLYVITARDKVTPQMIERAEAAGIPKENIIPAGSDEAKVRIIKENNINKHIDNKDSVIKALGDKGELFVPDAYPDLKADFVEMDLSDDDLNKLKEGGFVIEEYANGGEPDPKTNFYTVQGSDGVYRKVNGKWEVDWNRSGNFQPLSKGDLAKRTAVLNSQAKPLYDQAYDDLYTTQRQPFTSKPVNKPTPAKSTGKIESFDNSLYTADETTDYKPINYVDKNDPSKLYIIYGDNVIQPGRPGGSYIKDKDEKKKIKNNARLATQFDLDRLPANQIYSSPEELEYIRRAASGEDPYAVSAELKNKETANKDRIFFDNNFQLKDEDPNKWDSQQKDLMQDVSDKGEQFMRDWQNSPIYREMLSNSLPGDQAQYMPFYASGRDNQLSILNPIFMNEAYKPGEWSKSTGLTAAATSVGEGRVRIYPKTYSDIPQFTLPTHEYSHVADDNGRLIPQKDIDLMRSFIGDPLERKRQFSNYAYDTSDKGKQKIKAQYDYISDPTETRARLNELRFLGKDSGLYDPFTQKVTPEIFKQFNNLESFPGGNQPLEELKDVYTDEQILEMLNTISKNNESNQEFNFAQNGGQQGDRFKKRLMKRYPGMQGVYGAEGENLNIVKDPNYDARSAGYGDIEFIHPGQSTINYPNRIEKGGPEYTFTNPSPDKYTSVYNPKGANRGDIFLDMMHGMRDDPNYQPLLQNFEKAVRDARGGDMAWYYEDDVKNDGYTDGQEQWDENYIDSQLRAELAPGSIGMFSHGRKDYRKDRKYDSPEMRAAAKDIRNYLKGAYKDGGERKKRKKDSKGRYRSEDGNIRTPITPEMQAEMSPDEWGQYVQEVPEVYTTRTREQQEAINAARNMQLLNELKYQSAPHLYLPDGSLRPQAVQSADWFWQLGMIGPAALKGANAAMKIPLGAGVNVGGVLNAGMLAHGATQVDDRYQDWQDVAEGNMDWKEAALKTGMTALELSPAYGAAKKLLPQTYKINPWAIKENPDMMLYRARPVGQNPDMNMAAQLRAKEAAGESLTWYQRNLLNPQTNPEILAREKYYGQWFDKDPSRLEFYMNPGTRNFADKDAIEILRTRLPRLEANKLNISQFDDAKLLSASPETEFILPKDMISSAETFPESSWQQLIQEDAAFNKPHWLKGYPKGIMHGENQVLVQQSRLLNPRTKAKFFANQAPEIEPEIVVDRFTKLPTDHGNRITPENYDAFVNNIHGSTGYGLASSSNKTPTTLGIGSYGRPGTVFSDAPLSNLGKDVINAHEKNHGMFAGTLSKEMQDALLKPFGTRRPMPNYANKAQADEVFARMAQFKNALGMGDDQIFTLGHLNLIRKHYANRFIDNSITTMLSKIKPGSAGEKKFLRNMNKYAFGLGAVYLGAGALEEKQEGREPKRKKTKFQPGTYDPNETAGYMLEEYADGGLVEVRGYEGNKFRKNANGKWEYESGRPVEDQLLIQKLTYESKPVGSPVIQGAPKPVMNQTIWENAAGTSQKNAIAREKQLQALKASPVLADQEKAEQIEWERSRAAAAQQAAQDAKWRNEQPLDMMDWLWGAAVVGPTVAPAAWAAAETAGTAAMPYINAAFNTIPGQLATSGFAADAIVNRLYPSAGKIQEGKYGEAATDIATGLLDLYGANMLSPIYKGAKATVSELGKGLYEAGNAGVDLAKTNPQAWFKTPEQILETPGLYSSAMGRTSWKDPVGKLLKFVDDAKMKSLYKRENALLDKYPGFENRNIRIPLQQEEHLKQLQIQKAIEERNLRRSKLPIKQVLTEQGTKLGGGQGRIFVNTLNPEEVIKIGTFPGGSEELANLVQAGKNLEGMPLMENVAFPTKAFTLKTPKVKGNTVIMPNSEAVQFMPWKGNPLDVKIQ